MNKLINAAWVIGRRDFVATVYSKAFLLFLLGPLLILGISFGAGNMAEDMARQDMRSTVGVIAPEAEFKAIEAARTAVSGSFRDGELPDLVRAEPDYVIEGQIRDLLKSPEKRIVAVLTGGTTAPKLTGAISETGSIRNQMTLILQEARQQRALAAANSPLPPLNIAMQRMDETAGATAAMRTVTARMGQLFLFTLTLMLATMLLSNLIEEKSNKVIEILAAAVPIDAVFLGKLFSMLAISLVGIGVWVGAAAIGLAATSVGGSLTEPAVGWPLFIILVLVYYSANYLLLGALFLGIGSQATSIREVQTLSMPVTIAQLLLFGLASFATSPGAGIFATLGAIFPYSSPLVMIARAAQDGALWPHLLAILWQALWVWITVKLASKLFRRNVMKSGSSAAPTLKAAKAQG